MTAYMGTSSMNFQKTLGAEVRRDAA